jgi:hypothetical protein
MSTSVLTFFNDKGRVGKSSLVYHLSWMLAHMGYRVLACDLDPQANLTAAWHYCESTGVRGRMVTLQIKLADFQIITRSRSLPVPIFGPLDLGNDQCRDSRGSVSDAEGVRLIGVSLSSLCAGAIRDADLQMILAL